MTIPHLDAKTVRALVPVPQAASAIRAAFSEPIDHTERVQLHHGGADILIMPAAIATFAGVKTVVVQPANEGTGRPLIGGSYVLFDVARGEAIATMDGAALTTVRTPAVSAIAVDALAIRSARRAVIIGRGVQGRAHLETLHVTRPDLAITIIGRAPTPVEREAVRQADIVITCTSSPEPLLDVDDVSEQATIIAIGSYRPDRAELTPRLVRSCQIWVDDHRAARAEAGDLIQAVEAGWSWSAVRGDLGSLCRGVPTTSGRRLFKSVGLAAQDLIVAVEAWTAHRQPRRREVET